MRKIYGNLCDFFDLLYDAGLDPYDLQKLIGGIMHARSSVVAALAFIVSACLLDAAQAQRPSGPAAAGGLESPIGRVESVSGSVTVQRSATVPHQAALSGGNIQPKTGDFVYRGDVIQTGADGKLGLTFADGTAFNVSHNARMELNEFVYNPDSKSNSSFFSLVRGSFTFVAGKIAKTGSMKVDTPVATMGIRGTTPHVVISEDGTVKFSTLVEEKKK
jgi:hypothetical protein